MSNTTTEHKSRVADHTSIVDLPRVKIHMAGDQYSFGPYIAVKRDYWTPDQYSIHPFNLIGTPYSKYRMCVEIKLTEGDMSELQHGMADVYKIYHVAQERNPNRQRGFFDHVSFLDGTHVFRYITQSKSGIYEFIWNPYNVKLIPRFSLEGIKTSEYSDIDDRNTNDYFVEKRPIYLFRAYGSDKSLSQGSFPISVIGIDSVATDIKAQR